MKIRSVTKGELLQFISVRGQCSVVRCNSFLTTDNGPRTTDKADNRREGSLVRFRHCPRNCNFGLPNKSENLARLFSHKTQIPRWAERRKNENNKNFKFNLFFDNW